MAKEGHCYVDDQDEEEEEGYIDMDIDPATCYTRCCTAKEFEFQMSSRGPEADHSSTSPADEIFYKGKLLPLHLPPRLQMVETLLLLQKKPDNADADASGTTPFASCNVSPATSCYVSGELSPEDFFFEEEEGEEGAGCPREPAGPRAAAAAKRSWAKKLRSIRLQSASSLGLKLRASKAYIQSLFSKSSSAAKPKECSSKSKEERAAAVGGECGGGHRRSFSGAATALKRRSSNKFSSSSSSSSCSSSDSSSSSSLKRSSSVSSDKECSVQGAIAHCKRSQQARQAFGRKSVSDVGFYLKSGPRVVDAGREERN